MFNLELFGIIMLDFSGGFMGNKICVYEKTILILSSGIVLVMGVQHIRASEVKKLSHRLSNINFEYDFDDAPLNNVYSEFTSQIDASSIYEKYITNEFDYSVHNYIPTLSNDFISYTFYDDYIKIDLLNDDEVYSRCFYNNDDSYSIMFNCESNFDDKLYTLTYNFSSDGVLTDYAVYDGFFENSNDDINNYTFVKKISRN